jgi:hypothetical protein
LPAQLVLQAALAEADQVMLQKLAVPLIKVLVLQVDLALQEL